MDKSNETIASYKCKQQVKIISYIVFFNSTIIMLSAGLSFHEQQRKQIHIHHFI